MADTTDHEDIVLSALKVGGANNHANKMHQFRHMTATGQKIVIEMADALLKSMGSEWFDEYCEHFRDMFIGVGTMPYKSEYMDTLWICLILKDPYTIPIIENTMDWLVGIEDDDSVRGGARDIIQRYIDSGVDVLVSLYADNAAPIDFDSLDLNKLFPDLARLNCCDRRGECIGTISHQRLKFLELAGPRVYLGNLPNLLSLDITYCHNWLSMREEMVADRLEVLKFSYTDDNQRVIVSDMPNLRELSFSQCEAGIKVRTETLPRLESVYMYGAGYRYTYEPVERLLLREGFQRAEYHEINCDRPCDLFELTPSYFVARVPTRDQHEFSVSRIIRPEP